MRRFVIGDIHGCSKSLRTIIETIAPGQDDQVIFLGDYIDRGADSKNVVDQVIELQSRCRVVALKGNHELMLSAILHLGIDDTVWLANGGRATVTSYGGSLSKIPDSHLQFFGSLRPYFENDQTICVHAGYDPNLPMKLQTDASMHWNHLPTPLPNRHQSGKRVFVGHTPQPFGNVLNGGHIVCIDTYCFGGGYLTAFDLDTDELIQVDVHGHLRRNRKRQIRKFWSHLRDRLYSFVRAPVAGNRETTDGVPTGSEIEEVKLKTENSSLRLSHRS